MGDEFRYEYMRGKKTFEVNLRYLMIVVFKECVVMDLDFEEMEMLVKFMFEIVMLEFGFLFDKF